MTLEASRMKASLNTESGHFSQVVAVSQAAVNRQFKTLFRDFPELQTIKASSRRAGELVAKLKPPRVSFVVNTNTRDVVKYYCEFESGTIKLTAIQGDGFEPEIDVKGWCFVFKVNIGSINAPEDSARHKTRKPTAKHAPGDYSVKQLFLDFNTNTIMNPEWSECTFNGFEWDKPEDSLAFTTLLAMWGLEVIKNPDSTTLGDVTTHKDPTMTGKFLSSFPPTSLMFQTYGYITPGKAKPDPNFEGTADSNMLLYLEMTGNKDFPIERVLLYKGNFITPGMDGTLCICRENFWDNLLLGTVSPLLVAFNRATWAWVDKLTAEGGFFSGGYTAKYGISDQFAPAQTAEFYAWEKNGQCAWKWNKKDHKLEKDTNASIEIWCQTDNEIFFTPGTNEITVKGSTYLKSKFKIGLDGIEVAQTITWAQPITIGDINTAGAVSLNLFNVEEQFKPAINSDNWGIGHADGESRMRAIVQQTMNANKLESTRKYLRSALTGLGTLIVPTGKTFITRNPKFNNTGDLFFELEYRS